MGASQKATKSYGSYFDKKVKQLPKLESKDWVYVDRVFHLKKEKTDTITQELSEKLVPKKDEPSGYLQ